MVRCVIKQTVVVGPVQMDMKELNLTQVGYIWNVTLLIEAANILKSTIHFSNISLFSQVYKAGKYGKACHENCGACVNSTVCNHITGLCELGCEPGWQKTETCKTGKWSHYTGIGKITCILHNWKLQKLRLGCVWFQFHLIMFIFNISLQQWNIWTQLPVQV